jgi:predicted dehydrogenase
VTQKSKRLFIFSPWFIAAMVLAIIGGITGVILDRKFAQMVEPAAAQWINASPLVRNIVGDVKSLEVIHNSTWGMELSGTWHGRQRYLVHGAVHTLDLLVYWRKEPGAGAVKIEKIEEIDSHGIAKIWP